MTFCFKSDCRFIVMHCNKERKKNIFAKILTLMTECFSENLFRTRVLDAKFNS